MGYGDLLEHFDSSAYRRRLEACSETDVRQREIAKRRQIYGASFKIGAGAAGATWTGGLSLLGSGLGLRQLSIAEKKLAVIQGIMHERGWDLHQETKRDVLIPLAAGVAGLAVGGAVDIGLGDAIAAGTQVCVQEGAQLATHHGAAEIATQAIAHPVDFVEGAQQGIEMTAAQLQTLGETGNAAGNMAVATLTHAIPIGAPDAMVGGMLLGHEAGMAGAHDAAAVAASLAVQHGADKVMQPKGKSKNQRESVIVVTEVTEEKLPRDDSSESKKVPSATDENEKRLLALCAEVKTIQDKMAKLDLKEPGYQARAKQFESKAAIKSLHEELAKEREWVDSYRRTIEENAVRFQNLSNQMKHKPKLHTAKSFKKLEECIKNMQYCISAWSNNIKWDSLLQRAQTALDTRTALLSSLDKCEAHHQNASTTHQSLVQRAQNLTQRTAKVAQISTRELERRLQGSVISDPFRGRAQCHEARKWETRAQDKFNETLKLKKSALAAGKKNGAGAAEAVLAWVESVDHLKAMETTRSKSLDTWANYIRAFE